MVNITNNWIWINGNKYEYLDEMIVEVKRIFTKNHFYNGGRNGGNAIRFNKDMDRFAKFFGLSIDGRTLARYEEYSKEKDFILLKKDLDKYISDVKDLFKNPPEDYKYYGDDEEERSGVEAERSGVEEKKEYKEIKTLIHDDFKTLMEEYNEISESFFEFEMYCKKDKYDLLYILPKEGEVQQLFNLLRLMAIPDLSYFHIMKLMRNKEVIFYLKLSSDKIQTFGTLDEDSKDLIIDSSTTKQLWASLNAGHNIILTGVPGTGKTHLATLSAKEVMGEKGFVLTTATSDWTTFDTIGGLIPKKDGELEFREGKFLQSIRENKWLIIDEINRADIDKAFGQLFTVLSGQDVELPYYQEVEPNNSIPIKIKSCDEYDSFYDEKNATYYIGKNWRIIATMNSYDKNALFDLSYAFMRRFMIIEVSTPSNIGDFIIKLKNNEGEVLYDKFADDFTNKIEKLYEINLESNKIDRKLGPAIFLDILKYLYYRMDLEGNSALDENNKYCYDNKIFSEALIAYVIPQFEGLGSTQRKEVEKFLDEVFENEDSGLVKSKLNDMKSYFN